MRRISVPLFHRSEGDLYDHCRRAHPARKVRGKIEGKIEGEIKDKQQILIRLLANKFSLEEAYRKRMLQTRDKERLDQAIDLLLDAASAEEVLEPLD